MSRQQRRSQRAVFDLATAEDIARADPHHPRHQRTQHRVQELEQFTSVPDRMVVDFQAQGGADFDVYRVNHPARALERPDFVQKVEAVFRGPGDSAEAQKIGLAFVQHCRAHPDWSARLQEAARCRREREGSVRC